MAIILPPFFDEIYTDQSNNPLTNGYLRPVYAGTANAAPTYDDHNVINPVNVMLDIGGRCEMRLDSAIVYDIYIYNSFGDLIRTRTNVFGASGSGGDLSAYIPKAGHNARSVIGNTSSIAGEVSDIVIANDISSNSVDVIPTVRAVHDAIAAIPAGDDHKVMVDGADASPGYLFEKLVPGDNVDLQVVAGHVVISVPGIGNVIGSGTIGRTAAWTDTHTLADSESLTVDTTVTPVAETGKISWNQAAGTFNFGLKNGVTLQAGMEGLIPVHNEQSYTIQNGFAVGLTSGTTDGEMHVQYVNNTNATAYDTIAVATQDIAPGDYGYVTKWGQVHDIDTIALTEDAFAYLGATDGQITSVKPAYPAHVVQIGRCITSSATAGLIYVDITVDLALEDLYNVYTENTPAAEGDTLVREGNRWINRNYGAITKDPTGFKDPEDVIVSYDQVTRKVTLTGTVEAYWRASLIPILVPGWVSEAAPAGATTTQFLLYNGTAFVWSSTPWTFDQLQICAAVYSPSGFLFAIRETHGTMAWQTHSAFHKIDGCYNTSGGDISGYTIGSTTAAQRRPDVSANTLNDEDLLTINSALTSKVYARLNLTGTNTTVIATAQSEIISLTTTVPNYNFFTGGVWTQAPFTNNDYGAIFVYSLPMAVETQSQASRYLFVQPQTKSGTESTIQALSPDDVNLGEMSALNHEIVCIGRIIIRYTGGNWTITQVDKISGSKNNQILAGGTWLSSVSHDVTLGGDGTVSAPLALSGEVITDLNMSKVTDCYLTVGAPTGTKSTVVIQGLTATEKRVLFGVGTNARWGLVSNGDAESTGNAGSSFSLKAYTDGGVLIESVFTAIRAAGGNVYFYRPIDVNQNLTVSKITSPALISGATTSTNAQVIIRSTAGTQKIIRFRTADLDRWTLVSNATAEGGANAGSNFEINAYADDGVTLIDSPLAISRVAGGGISLRRNVIAFGNYLSNTANGGIFGNSNDGTDIYNVTLSSTSGQTSSRGGYITVKGNEVATNGGDIVIEAGVGNNGDIIMRTNNAERTRIKKDGNITTTLPTATAINTYVASATDISYNTLVTGDVIGRTAIYPGKIEFGVGGGTARDVNLYRSAANVLKTDDAFQALGVTAAGGPVQVDTLGQGFVAAFVRQDDINVRVGRADGVTPFITNTTPANAPYGSTFWGGIEMGYSLGVGSGYSFKLMSATVSDDRFFLQKQYAGNFAQPREIATRNSPNTFTDVQNFQSAESHALRSVATAGATTSALATDYLVAFTGTLTQTYTLPATGSTARQIIIKNRSTGAVTVNRTGADTIDGLTTFTLTTNQSVTLVSNGTDWLII